MDVRKAQASFFMILGVVLVLIVGMFLMLTFGSREQVEQSTAPFNLDTIVNLCLQQEFDWALIEIASTAGHWDLPDGQNVYNEEFSIFPFWYWVGYDYRLTDNYVAGQLGDATAYFTELCIEEAFEFPLTINDIVTNVQLLDTSIIVDMEIRGHVSVGDTDYQFSSYRLQKDVRLKETLQLARELIDEYKTGWSSSIISPERDYFLLVGNRGYGFIEFQILDGRSRIRDAPLVFGFSGRFETPENYPPYLIPQGVVYGRVGEEVVIQYEAEDDHGPHQLTYRISSWNIPGINETTGEIRFTPTYAGTFEGVVTVTDGWGETDTDFLIIEVEE